MIKITSKLALFTLLFLMFAGAILLVSAESPANQSGGLAYSTFVGTSSWDGAEAITVDSSGRAYIVARTESINGFPGSFIAPSIPGEAHEVDLVVFRLNPAGTAIEYTLYFHPSPAVANEDHGYDIAVDSSGSAYIVGQADKANLCTFMGNVPGYDQTYNGGVDAFVMKIKPDGSGLVYCTFIGGSNRESAYTIELDQNNNAYVAGYTWSANFPVTGGAYDTSINGDRDVFVAKLNATGTSLAYATYLGGSGEESAVDLTLDSQNNAYVTGYTNSDNLPVPTAVIDNSYNGNIDAFLFKISSDGSTMPFNTYLGGPGEDQGTAVLLDNQNNIYLTGSTRSGFFPTTPGAFDRSWNGGVCNFVNCADAFAVKLNSTASSFHYSTYLGGFGEDLAYGLSLKQDGGLFITGESIATSGFPTTPSAYDSTNNGEGDAFLLSLNSAGSEVNYGTFLGASDVDQAYDLWSNGQSTVYLTGKTSSFDFPTTPGSFDTQSNGNYDIFVTKLLLPASLTMYRSYIPSVTK